MKIALFYKKDKADLISIDAISDKISKAGFELVKEHPDVVLYIGGDGSFLRAVHHFSDEIEKVKFIGLCKGHLGFFYSYKEDELGQLLDDLKSNSFKEQSYRLIEADLGSEKLYAVNEIRIESPFHTLISDVYINDEYLETFRGNGLVVCSSIGSSAYNKSLGGAVINPSLDVLELTEIAPINNRVYKSLHSSLVVDDKSPITLKTKTENILIGFDELVSETNFAKEIKFVLSNRRVTVLYKKNYSYTSLIKSTFTGDK